MSFNIYSDLDAHLGELLRVRAENVTMFPTATTADKGRFVYLTTDITGSGGETESHRGFYYCDGTRWIPCGMQNVVITGNGNVLSGVSYDPQTGVLTLTKGVTALTEHQDISGKVDKVAGKGLSTNDYTTAEKNKLAGIASGAEVNVQSDWDETDTNSDAFIKNKPEINNGKLTIKAGGTSKGTFTANQSGNTEVNITKSDIGLGNVTNDAQVKRTEMGVAGGVATLDTEGKVPSSQLPSYVDDVLEYDKKASFPTTGETGKIYVDKTTNLTWRWSGSAYTEISPSLALGETSSTAYAGDKGKALADTIAKTSLESDHTLEWNTDKKIATVNNVALTVKLPAKPTDNNYTTAEKNKLAGIASGAEVNVQSDWNQSDSTKDDYIKNKPSIPTKLSELTIDTSIQADKLKNTQYIDGIPFDGSVSVDHIFNTTTASGATYDATTNVLTLNNGTYNVGFRGFIYIRFVHVIPTQDNWKLSINGSEASDVIFPMPVPLVANMCICLINIAKTWFYVGANPLRKQRFDTGSMNNILPAKPSESQLYLVSTGVTDRPHSTFDGFVLSSNWSQGSLATQIAWDIDDASDIWVRTRATTWGAWKRIARAEDLPTKLSQLTNDCGFADQRKNNTIVRGNGSSNTKVLLLSTKTYNTKPLIQGNTSSKDIYLITENMQNKYQVFYLVHVDWTALGHSINNDTSIVEPTLRVYCVNNNILTPKQDRFKLYYEIKRFSDANMTTNFNSTTNIPAYYSYYFALYAYSPAYSSYNITLLSSTHGNFGLLNSHPLIDTQNLVVLKDGPSVATIPSKTESTTYSLIGTVSAELHTYATQEWVTDQLKTGITYYEAENLTGGSGTIDLSSSMSKVLHAQFFIDNKMCLMDCEINGAIVKWTSNVTFTTASKVRCVITGLGKQ